MLNFRQAQRDQSPQAPATITFGGSQSTGSEPEEISLCEMLEQALDVLEKLDFP